MTKALLTLPLLFAACTESPSTTFDLQCAGEDAPERVSQRSGTDGIVLDEVGGRPIAGAFVDAGVIASRGTDADCRYEMYPSGLPVMRRAFADGFLDAVAYDPMTDRQRLPLPMLDEASVERITTMAGIRRDPAKGMLLIIIEDCAGAPLPGATIEVPGAESPIYLGPDTRLDPRLDATTSNSAALIFNVPIGTVDAVIDVDGVGFRPFEIESRANTLVTSWRQP